MDSDSLAPAITPHGHLVLAHDAGAPSLDAALARRLQDAFERGSGHGLLWLGADETGAPLPPVYSYWREFGARYVTALCTQLDIEASGKKVSLPHPSEEELNWMALAAPPMAGAEYLTAAVLDNLWRGFGERFLGWVV